MGAKKDKKQQSVFSARPFETEIADKDTLAQLLRDARAHYRAAKKGVPEYVPLPDPKEELQRNVRIHKCLLKAHVRHDNMSKPTIVVPGVGRVPNRLPEELLEEIRNSTMIKETVLIEVVVKRMQRALKKVPIWTEFLRYVYGVGDITAAYLAAYVDIHKAEKASALKRYCGFAVINGRIEKMSKKGETAEERTRKYNPALRQRFYVTLGSMVRTSNNTRKGAAPYGVTSKYLDVWFDCLHRRSHSRLFDPINNTWDGRKGGRSLIFSAAWHKAVDVLLEDLHVFWRSLEGLSVYPAYKSEFLNHVHGPMLERGEIISVGEAWDCIGEVGPVTLEEPRIIPPNLRLGYKGELVEPDEDYGDTLPEPEPKDPKRRKTKKSAKKKKGSKKSSKKAA